MEKPSSIERVAGNVGTQSTLTALAALVAGPLAALLPVLANSLAAERHKRRVEKALEDINILLLTHTETLRSISDDQFKFVNEMILAVLQTTENEKLAYLKQAIANGLSRDIDLCYSVQLSRMLRDISSAELRFLVENFQYESIVFDVGPNTIQELRINGESAQGAVVTGLISLGLIIPARSTLGALGKYRFSPLVTKLMLLVLR